MARTVVGLLGVITAVAPDRIVDLFETVAVENPEDLTVRSWFAPAIRIEGVLIAIVCLAGGRAYAGMMAITGAFGALLLFVPRLYLRAAGALVYERPEEIEWSDRIVNGLRAIGVLYVLLGLRTLWKRRRGR